MWKRVLLAAALFYAFIPGVLVTLPPKGSKMTVQLVHAALFAVVLYYAMKHLRYEHYGNHGPAGCPPGTHQGYIHGSEQCIPSSGTRQHPPGSEEKKA